MTTKCEKANSSSQTAMGSAGNGSLRMVDAGDPDALGMVVMQR